MHNDTSIMAHRHVFVKAIAESLRTRCRVKCGQRLLLAVSGGADSIALLHAISALAGQPHWCFDLHVAHINHHLRAEAASDALFVQNLASRLALPCTVVDIHPASQSGNLECAARKLRYKALTQVAIKIEADGILTAHHADDQLETLLMRLVRGTSIAGLSGIAPYRTTSPPGPPLLRPMLRTDHAQAVGFLTDMQQNWCEDSTNADVSRWRARLRRDVLPALRELRADVAVKSDDAAEHLRQVATYLNHAVTRAQRRWITIHEGTPTLSRDKAKAIPLPILSSLLRRVSIQMGVPSDKLTQHEVQSWISAIRDSRGDTRRFDLAQGWHLVVTAETVQWVRYDSAHEAED